MICAIHQPNFFPWLGYFRKIALADVFVFLDAVPFPRTSRGTWSNRVKLLIGGKAQWVTCPIRRGSSGKLINEVQIDDSQPWREKLIRTIRHSYTRARRYDELVPWVEAAIGRPESNLAEYNIASVRKTAERFGLECRFMRQSEFYSPAVHEATGSERLAAICREVGADTYLAGDGADEYEDVRVYESHGIRLVRSGFTAVEYPQIGAADFVPGLSVLDALLNEEVCSITTVLKS